MKQGEAVPRLTRKEFGSADERRFRTEAAFYMELEDAFFQQIYHYLKKELGLRALVVGTSDHNHGKSGYPLLCSTSKLDVVDGHVYWQHPRYFTDPKTKRRTFSIRNSPMVNEPLNSTVVQLSRSAVAGKPYTVSETNHPFPSEYACEGIGILAAYSAFHDWDGIFFYTFEHSDPKEWGTRIPKYFDIRPDPVRMTNLAAGAIMFLRADVRPALQTIRRSYSTREIYESIRYPSSERPYFTPGFALSSPLRHTTRIVSFNEGAKRYPKISTVTPVVSDTKELVWHRGLVTVETERSQALIGFVKDNSKTLKNISAEVENEFCSIIVASLDDRPLSGCKKMLIAATARSANSGTKWNEKRTSLVDWGTGSTVIEPVKGQVTLRNLEPTKSIEAIALDGAGKALGRVAGVKRTDRGYRIDIGEPATTWYLINVLR